MAKGMLSLTVALLLSAMCTVEGQNASGAAAAAAGGGGGGYGGAAAAAASAGGGYSGLGYGGDRYLPSGYNSPQYVINPVPNPYLPRRYAYSDVVAPIDEEKRTGLGFFEDILNKALKIKAFNNSNGAPNPANTS